LAAADEVVTWANPTATAPSRAEAASAVLYTSPAHTLYSTGGVSTTTSTGTTTASLELWSYATTSAAWSRLADAPAGLRSATLAAVGTKLYLMGGLTDAGAYSSNVHVYDTLADAWTTYATSYARAYHTANVNAGTVVLSGGVATTASASEPLLLTFDTTTNAFSAQATTGSSPGSRRGHSAVISHGKLYVWGGDGASAGETQTIHALDLTSWLWEELQSSGSRPYGRKFHSAAIVGNHRMYVFGGVDAVGVVHNDVHVLDLTTRLWSATLPSGTPPTARQLHSALLVDQSVYVFGGYTGQVGDVSLDSGMYTLARHCQGTLALSDAQGTIELLREDAYTSSVCEWRLQPAGANREVRLYFSAFAFDPGHELLIYDGGSATDPLARPTGAALPGPYVSSTGELRVHFDGSGMGSNEGFAATYTAVCAAGYHEVDGTCTPCANGTYGGAAGDDTCTPCDVRSYGAALGASACTPCPDFSRAAAPGSAAYTDCLCQEGHYRPNASAIACERCPTGADCLTGVAFQTSLPYTAAGYCRQGDSNPVYRKCCSASACPAGASAASCPAELVALGADSCPTANIVGLSILAFVIALVILLVSCGCCWFTGFAAGVRKGHYSTVADFVKRFHDEAFDDSLPVEADPVADEELASLAVAGGARKSARKSKAWGKPAKSKARLSKVPEQERATGEGGGGDDNDGDGGDGGGGDDDAASDVGADGGEGAADAVDVEVGGASTSVAGGEAAAASTSTRESRRESRRDSKKKKHKHRESKKVRAVAEDDEARPALQEESRVDDQDEPDEAGGTEKTDDPGSRL
jgi:N-acetylneuraminic acid mutarotase